MPRNDDVTEIKSIEDLRPDLNNANQGTLRGRAMLERSLRQYGAGRSVLADKHGNLIAGNKTTEIAAELGLEIEVIKTDGSKLIVVQREDLDLHHDLAARELAYADNRVAELDLSWNLEAMEHDAAMGLDFNLFFDPSELDRLKAVADAEAAASAVTMEDEPLNPSTVGLAENDPVIPEVKEQFLVLVECATDAQQADLLDRLMEEGYTCRALMS